MRAEVVEIVELMRTHEYERIYYGNMGVRWFDNLWRAAEAIDYDSAIIEAYLEAVSLEMRMVADKQESQG